MDEQRLCAPRILTGPRSCSPEAPALFASAPSTSSALGSLPPAPGTDKHSERTASGAAEAAEPWARTGARSLQAALAGHSLDAIVRILSKPPEQVRATRGVYDSELSVTGLGLRADVEKVLGARSAEVVAALLARADVSTSGPLVHYIRQTERGGYEKNFSIRSSPAVKVAVPGSCIRYSAYQDSALSSAGSYTTFQWLCLNDPEASQVYGMPALVRGPGTADWEATWAFPGNHRILCRVQTYLREEGGGFKQAAPQYIEFQQTVHEPGDVLARALDKQRLHAAPERQMQALLMYQQALRTAEQRAGSAKRSPKDAAALNSQIEKLRERLRSSEGRSRYPLKAAHVEAASAKVNPLNVFLARTAQSSGSETWSLVDITNPTDRRLTGEYTGHGKDSKQAIQSALAAWDRGNRYPKGRLRVQVPQETGAPSDTEFQTDGASFWDSVAEFFSQVGFWAGLGMLGAAVAMTVAPDPTVSKAAAVLLWTSILAGTTGTSISMIQRHAQGMSTAGEDAMDALTLASNLLGGRWALGATVKGLSLAGSRMGTAVVIGRIGTDTAQGILLAAESVKEYQQILADPDPKQRTDRLVQFLGHLALNGGLLTLSMHGNRADLQKLGAQRACLAKLGHTGEVVSAEGAAACTRRTACTRLQGPRPNRIYRSRLPSQQSPHPLRSTQRSPKPWRILCRVPSLTRRVPPRVALARRLLRASPASSIRCLVCSMR